MSIKIIFSFHFFYATSLQKRHANSLKLWAFGGIFCIKFKYINGSISSTSKSDHLNFCPFIGGNNGNIGLFFCYLYTIQCYYIYLTIPLKYYRFNGYLSRANYHYSSNGSIILLGGGGVYIQSPVIFQILFCIF